MCLRQVGDYFKKSQSDSMTFDLSCEIRILSSSDFKMQMTTG